MQRQQARRRRWMLMAGILFVLFLSASSVVRFYTDLLWFHEINLGPVFWRTLWARLLLGVAGGLGAAIVVYANLEVTRRSAPRYRFVTPAGDVAERYRSMFQPYAVWANAGVALMIGLLTGASTSTTWERFLLWRRAQPFGSRDALFGRDVSFFVFGLPFQRTVLSWLFGIVVASLLLSILGHLLNGSIEPTPNRVNFRPAVKVHVSVLLGMLALLKAWGYVLAKYELVYSPRGAVTGATYTDVHAQLPAFRLLVVIALVAAAIFFVNIRFRGWLLPGAAAALWAFSSILIGAVIPWSVQRFRVEPNESDRERPFIARNIAATRRAYGLERLQLKEFPAENTLNADLIAQNQETVDNLRVWDPETLKQWYKQLHAIRPYYQFIDVDIDRYTIDDRQRQVMLGPREVLPTQLDERSRNWINTKLVYTHGYGIVAANASGVTPEGEPELIVSDLPPRGPEELTGSRQGIYYGEDIPDYAVVRTKQLENDYPVGEKQEKTSYAGTGGVELSNALRRLAFGWRFGDANLLISNFVTPQSRIIMRRDILERAHTAAPFLRFDHDPYIVSANGRLQWVIDAYTSTDRYPYSQAVSLDDVFLALHNKRQQRIHVGNVNYMRNSVKVVIDAYDGTMRFYVVDPGDAMIATYQAIFPELFTPDRSMPPELRAHLRYPEALFVLQAWQYRLYHTTDPDRVYQREDVWDFPADPALSTEQAKIPMEPYYLLMKLPGEEKAEFLIMLPFTPGGKPNLNGWVAGRSDPEHYGQLVGFSFPRGRSIGGPENIAARIEQDPIISQQFTIWQGAGSDVLRGNLLVIPIEKSLIYVRPIYLRAQQSALPELRRVVVVYGDRIGFEPTLEASLAKALAGQPPTVETVIPGLQPVPQPSPPPGPAPAGDVASLLDQAAEHFRAADEALKRGDLATYQRENQAARDAVERARQQR